MPETKGELPILEFKDQLAWEHWLADNHSSADGAWLKFAKKAAPVTTLDHTQALEGALCYGWIDGQAARYDEHYHLIRFTPRRKRSKWSQINVEKATALIEAGRMKAAGQAAIDAAKSDGRWDAAYPPQSSAPVPDDFRRALEENPDAKAFFDTLTGATRYAFLYRLHHVTRPPARAQRIADYIDLLGQQRTLS
ncbi:MAG: YdeI/OmpD-associated family protein [Solirubrobacterales bacterium]|nr:YdeI/OmpD-associated family protein [Solirubrobacterales bacterium]